MKCAWCVPYIHGLLHLPTFDVWSNNNYNHGIDTIIVYAYWYDVPANMRQYMNTHKIVQRNYSLDLQILRFSDQLSYNRPHQKWAIRDCFAYTKIIGYEWVFFGDIDEFITIHATIPAQKNKMRNFLQNHQEYPCISFGKQNFANVISLPNKKGICARMLTTEQSYCYRGQNNNFCRDWLGARKYALQPHKMTSSTTLQVHSCGREKTISTNIARLNHWCGAGNSAYFHTPSFENTTRTNGLAWIEEAYGSRLNIHQEIQSILGCSS